MLIYLSRVQFYSKNKFDMLRFLYILSHFIVLIFAVETVQI